MTDETQIDDILSVSGIVLPDADHGRRCAAFAAILAHDLSDLLDITSRDQRLAVAAALLHDAGYVRGARDHHRKSYDIVREARLPMFDVAEQLIIACAARYHGHTNPNIEHAGFGTMSFEDQRRVRRITAIVRLAAALDASHLGVITDIVVDRSDHEPVLIAYATADASTERDRLHEAAGSVHHLIQQRIRTDVRLRRGIHQS